MPRLVRVRTRKVGLLPADAVTVEVQARLQSGVVLPAVFPVPLDGVLAHAERRRRLGGSYGYVVDHHTDDLPLVPSFRLGSFARDAKKAFGQQWVWCATCAEPVGESVDDVRWIHKRFDDLAASMAVGRLPSTTDVGPTKAERIPFVATVCAGLRWLALGDPARIAALLDDVGSLGKRTGCGEGHVIDWSVTEIGPADPSAVLRHDLRPIPARAALWCGVETPEIIAHQIRPPYWRPAQTEVEAGGFARAGRDVIAPWS